VSVRFLADEDLDADIIGGLRSREPAIDILDVKITGLRGTKDPALLELAAQQDRILITHDRRTMTRHVRERMATGKSSPGLFIVSQQSPVGEIVEWLLLVWTASQAEEWRERSCTCPSGEILRPVPGGTFFTGLPPSAVDQVHAPTAGHCGGCKAEE